MIFLWVSFLFFFSPNGDMIFLGYDDRERPPVSPKPGAWVQRKNGLRLRSCGFMFFFSFFLFSFVFSFVSSISLCFGLGRVSLLVSWLFDYFSFLFF